VSDSLQIIERLQKGMMMSEETVIPVIPETTPVSVTVSFDDESKNHLGTAGGALSIARMFEIASHDDAQEAINERNANLKEIDWLEKRLEYVIGPFMEGVKRLRAVFKPAIDQRKAAVEYLNPLILEWDAKEKKRIAIENAEREETARRIRQEAEQKQAAELARAREEAAQKEAAAKEQEAKLAAAKTAGDQKAAQEAAQKAAALREQAAHVQESAAATATQIAIEAAATAPTPLQEAPKLAGNQMRDKWVAELLPTYTEERAMLEICAAITEGRQDLLGVLKMDNSALGKLASGLKRNMIVPGYVAMNRPIVAGSRK
jgi:protein subunit release factor B